MKEDEVLGVLLYKAEQITAEQVKASLEIMKRDGCRQGRPSSRWASLISRR